MGMDLILLPIEVDSSPMPFAHTMISCAQDNALFDEIMNLESAHSTPIPDNFASFVSTSKGADYKYGTLAKTPYGKDIRAITVAELLTVKAAAQERNSPAWAYLSALPKEMRVALFWC